MPFIPVPGGIQVELRMLLDGQRVENTLWFGTAGLVTQAMLQDAAVMVEDWFNDNMLPQLSNQLSLVEVYATDQSSQTGPVYSLTTGLPKVGALAGAAAPNQCAMAVTFRSARRGRSGRGRNYVCGILNSELVSNDWAPARVAAVQSAYGFIIARAAAVGLTWMVASRYTNNAPRAAGELYPIVSAVVIDATVDSQRRRTPGRGN